MEHISVHTHLSIYLTNYFTGILICPLEKFDMHCYSK